MAQRLGQATHHSHTASRPQERRWRLNRLTLGQRGALHGPTTWEADPSRYDTRVLQGRGWQLDRTADYRAVGSRAVGRSTVRVIGRRMFGLSAVRALRRLGAAALGHSGVRVLLVVCATKHRGRPPRSLRLLSLRPASVQEAFEGERASPRDENVGSARNADWNGTAKANAATSARNKTTNAVRSNTALTPTATHGRVNQKAHVGEFACRCTLSKESNPQTKTPASQT